MAERHEPLTLDHLGAMIWHLDPGAEAWRRLGFTLSRRSPQIGAVPGREGMQPWATANHCAVFRRGYLELIGIHDEHRFNPWAGRMARYEGLHIAAFRCADADAAWRDMHGRLEGFEPPVQRARMAPWGEHGEREMRFRNLFSRDDAWPEARLIVIEHQTPEVLWQVPLMQHPNGAAALTGATFVSTAPAALLKRLAHLLGRPVADGAVELPEGARLEALEPSAFLARHPRATLPPAPCLAGCSVAFDDPERAAALMRGNGVAVHDGEPPWVEVTGFVLSLASA